MQCMFLFKDLSLASLHDRLKELSKSTCIINSNMRQQNLPSTAQWMPTVTQPYSMITSPCRNVKVALLGLLSDEPNVFRDNTFRGVPITNVLDTYTEMRQQIFNTWGATYDGGGAYKASNGDPGGTCSGNNNDKTGNCMISNLADICCIPITHQSIHRDRELAQYMLQEPQLEQQQQKLGLIIGGHDHDPYDEYIRDAKGIDGRGNDDGDSKIRILKSGMDANAANLIDLVFALPDHATDTDNGFENRSSSRRPQLVDIQSELVEMKQWEPSIVLQGVVDKHMSVVKALEHEIIVDVDATDLLAPGEELSSEYTRYKQTTVGRIFCSMIKEELEVDAAIINGATIKGERTYETGQISYADLKKELPFPTKIVVVPMSRWELQCAIDYSRTSSPEGNKSESEKTREGTEENNNGTTFPRRGYLQVDTQFEARGAHTGGPDDTLHVAVPRNLLNGFCNITPLMDVGDQLKSKGLFPADDDYVPAIDLIVRHSCKNRWFQIYQNLEHSFEELDINHDGVLDRDEVKQMMTEMLGHEPPDFVVDDMIASIDTDENGVIDMGEFSYLLATMEREHGWKQF